jgi:hypothetical protein
VGSAAAAFLVTADTHCDVLWRQFCMACPAQCEMMPNDGIADLVLQLVYDFAEGVVVRVRLCCALGSSWCFMFEERHGDRASTGAGC